MGAEFFGIGEIGVPFSWGCGSSSCCGGSRGGITANNLTTVPFTRVQIGRCHPGIVAQITLLRGRFGGALGSVGAVGLLGGEIGVPEHFQCICSGSSTSTSSPRTRTLIHRRRVRLNWPVGRCIRPSCGIITRLITRTSRRTEGR